MPTTEEMLAEFLRDANEPRDRAIIMVLMQINANLTTTANDLIENTKATAELGIQFRAFRDETKDRAQRQDLMMSEGKGMFRSLSIAISLVGSLISGVLVVAGWIGAQHLTTLTTAVNTNTSQDQHIIVLETKVDVLGRRMHEIEEFLGMNGGKR